MTDGARAAEVRPAAADEPSAAADDAGVAADDRPILAIETSCDETAAAVVARGRDIMSNVVASQVELHAPYGGVFPELASRQHVRDIWPVIDRAMADAAVRWTDLAAIAVTYGPGLPGALLVGVNAAKGIALATGLPIVGVSHLEGHLYSNWLNAATAAVAGADGRNARPAGADMIGSRPAAAASPAADRAGAPGDPPFPHLALIVSGGHTDLVYVRGHGDRDVLGSTLDDAAGEAFDKAARLLGLGYPGGPAIERAAVGGNADAVALPVAATESPFDFSFSGLKTALSRIIEARTRGGATATDGLRAADIADLAASFQAAVVRALLGGVSRALAANPAREVHLAGGVSANLALRHAVRELGVPSRYPPLALCTDNAAMVAAAAYWAIAQGRRSGMDLDVEPGLGFP